MEEASQVRRVAREAVCDVSPEQFHDEITAIIEHGSMAPGVLVILCARAANESVHFTTIAERAAGTQLIYEGLRLTRTLAHETPWEHGEGDIDVLAADVLVARGFYLLARTEAARQAVETVRNFGRDQTRHPSADGGFDHRLEADIFELAAVAGTTTGGTHPSAECREFVADLARAAEDTPPDPDRLFDVSVRESLAVLVGTKTGPPEGVRPSATDS